MKPLLILFASCMIMASCTKDRVAHFAASGTITGVDFGACSCCGGYKLTMDGNDSIYRFFSFPAGSAIDSTHFPIHVSFNYVETGSCDASYHYLSIQSIAAD